MERDKTYTEYYKCNLCGAVWAHQWDNDPNNDFTQCTGCFEFEFEEITKEQYLAEMGSKA